MNAVDFEDLRRLIYDLAGIALPQGKQKMLQGRLARRLRELGLDSERAYLDFLSSPRGGDEMILLLDAVTTNVTSFFRESAHFDEMKRRFRAAIKSGQRRFRIWSAAASSGQEPYTIAIVMDELARECGVKLDVRILGTDISTDVLRSCVDAVYTDKDIAVIPPELRRRQFEGTGEPGKSRVVARTRGLATFARLNLAKPPFPMKGPFDAVFCRNVMIYFDDVVRTRLIREIHRLLGPKGVFYIGHAESLPSAVEGFERIAPSSFIKEPA